MSFSSETPPKTRIAVNTRLFVKDQLEGVGWFTHEVVRRLVERHPDWEFLFLFDRSFDDHFVFGPNVAPIVVSPPARHPLLWYAWFNISLPRVFRRKKPDVFLSTDGHCSLPAPAPTVLVIHDIAHEHFPEQVPWIARQYYHHFIPRYLGRADRLITVSEFSRRDIHQHFGTPIDEMAVCGNGVRPEFQPLGDLEKEAVRQRYAEGQPYFFYLGSVNPRKNVHGLIRSFDKFKEKTKAPVKLLIGGRLGWLTGTVKTAFEQSPFQEDITFLDYIPNAELPKLLGAAVALTYVSLFEGFGVPLLEAMHAEVPVITSDTSSLPEVAGPAALLVNPYDPGDVAEAMCRVYSEAVLREKLIVAGRQQRKKYNWEKTTDVVERKILSAISD
jgi:glycosyltransferase involved in cell wall biosynthesis